MTACIRGCITARRHASDCATTACRGCLPRHADSGLLCWQVA